MAVLACPRCRHANPPEAVYCHYDGQPLRGQAAVAAAAELPREFIFPSGARCRSFDEMVLQCSKEWPAAKALLQQGQFRQFLAGIGRMDLALLADRAAAQADADLGLDQFLSQVPTHQERGPKLELTPRRVDLGVVTVNDTKTVRLTVGNAGGRMLLGTVATKGEPWLRIEGAAGGSATIKTQRGQEFTLVIDTTGVAAGQRFATAVQVITNGGAAEVALQFQLVAKPFDYPPLEGAMSPRDLAARMRTIPKQVVGLFECGAVERWFTANGWQYPVQGPTAKGIAAVQQFYEGLGLSKPPPLEVEPRSISLKGHAGELVARQVVVRTSQKKWVYAHVTSDQPWLRVTDPNPSDPQRVTIPCEIKIPTSFGTERLHARLLILANGKQRFEVPVDVRIEAHARSRMGRWLGFVLAGWLTAMLFRVVLLPLDVAWHGGWIASAADYSRAITLGMVTLGGVIGVGWAWRNGGWRDLVAGLLVGGWTGLMVGGTLAAAALSLDGGLAEPLMFWRGAAAATPAWWEKLAAWSVLGAGLGMVLPLLGRTGRAVMVGVAHLWAAGLARLGLAPLARWLA